MWVITSWSFMLSVVDLLFCTTDFLQTFFFSGLNPPCTAHSFYFFPLQAVLHSCSVEVSPNCLTHILPISCTKFLCAHQQMFSILFLSSMIVITDPVFSQATPKYFPLHVLTLALHTECWTCRPEIPVHRCWHVLPSACLSLSETLYGLSSTSRRLRSIGSSTFHMLIECCS